MPLECGSTSTKYNYNMVNEIDRALNVLRKYKINPTSDAFSQLYSIRGKILSQIGFKFPRPMSLIKKLVGLSPGTVALWHDAESGWFTEARVKAGAAPVYRHVTDEVAVTILKGELTHELEAELMKPDDYTGE